MEREREQSKMKFIAASVAYKEYFDEWLQQLTYMYMYMYMYMYVNSCTIIIQYMYMCTCIQYVQ